MIWSLKTCSEKKVQKDPLHYFSPLVINPIASWFCSLHVYIQCPLCRTILYACNFQPQCIAMKFWLFFRNNWNAHIYRYNNWQLLYLCLFYYLTVLFTSARRHALDRSRWHHSWRWLYLPDMPQSEWIFKISYISMLLLMSLLTPIINKPLISIQDKKLPQLQHTFHDENQYKNTKLNITCKF